MTCQCCQHRRARYVIAWRTPIMPAPAFWYQCKPCASTSTERVFDLGTRVRVRRLTGKWADR